MSFRTPVTGILMSGLMGLLGAAPAAAGGGTTYNYPHLHGAVVDHCVTWATNCGQGGADQFCRVAGLTRATAFQVYRPGKTYVIGSQRTCEGGFCVGFSQVTCEGSTATPPIVRPPIVTPPVVTPPIVNPPIVTPPPPMSNVIPANWFTRGQSYTPNGQRVSFLCPPIDANGYLGMWGTDIYTYDSGVCAAGVHVGAITRERGGVVTIEMRGGQSSYQASNRNGIASTSYGAYEKSFVVVR